MELKRIIALLMAVVFVFCLAGCKDDGTSETVSSDKEESSVETGKETYTVTVETAGGMPLEGLDVYIYGDASLEDLKQFGETNADGVASLSVAKGDGYVAVISGAPKGYDIKPSYPITGGNTKLVLESSLIKDGNLADVQLGLGDVMYDFTVTEASGKEVTLSEMLKEKDMVLLNFWYTTCSWCLKEFPYMEQAYQTYQDKVGIIALNPYEQNEVIKPFQETNGLSFTMANCPASWSNTFGVTGYPTSIVVDRYGVICLIEAGGLTSVTPFNNTFIHFTAENYEQKLCPNGIADISVRAKPTYPTPSAEEWAAVLNAADNGIAYSSAEGSDAEYNWPFIIGELDGEKVVYASNKGVENSYSILNVDVHLKKGEAISFDYHASCANGSDILYVLVDEKDIYQISGIAEDGVWERCYPWVADKEGDYKVSLCYMKGADDPAGDDTVYLKNFRIVGDTAIDAPTYIPREAAISEDGFEYDYVSIVYNENDGYYHVGSTDGPLLLANLMDTTQFNEEQTVYDMIADGKVVLDGKNYYDDIVKFCNYASNATLGGLCTVNKSLAEYLKIVAQVAGFDGGENEWLKICCYFDTYGTNGAQLSDPIAGLAPFSAYTATLGKNIESNYFYYDRVIMPRGTFAKFVPATSGVYRITSRTDTNSNVEGWIFNASMEELTVYERDERLYTDENNVSIVYYMEAGTEYFIDIAYWDLYETGTIYYDIEYVAASYELFRLASPGYFTYDTNATGDAMYYTIAGGIDVIEKDGKFYHKKKDGSVGSVLYADFSGYTPIFTSMSITDVINNGGFNFTRTEDDEFILSFMHQNDDDPEKTRAYLKEYWGNDFDAYAEEYQLDDVLAGRYHGKGEDLTEQIKPYLSKMASSPKEREGCVEVDSALAALLQQLMDKYTFKGVDHSWTKLCYYYDRLGPNN